MDLDDDVFEDAKTYQVERNGQGLGVVDNSQERRTPSPSGYRGYKPPDEVLKFCQTDAIPLDDVDESIVHKVILLGDSGVGKTSLLVQFETGKFQKASFAATVGIGFTNKTVMVDSVKVNLQIWDTAGQERFRSVTHAYYRGAHALLLLYDVTNKTSFDNIRAWLVEIKEYAQDDVVIMLIGNKSDCTSNRVIQYADGARLAREHDTIFMETSAKSGLNVEVSFLNIARELLRRQRGDQGTGTDKRNNATDLPGISAALNITNFFQEQRKQQQNRFSSCAGQNTCPF